MSTEWFLFYGSLRRGMDNYRLYAPALEYHHTQWLYGYRMYALAHYPYVVKTGSQTDRILVELFRIRNASVRNEIHKMELSVGYEYAHITIDAVDAIIYLFKEAGNEPVVDGGDWIKFYGKTESRQH